MDEEEAAAQALINQTIGGFLVERVLGVGGMGSVVAARRSDGAVAALKVLHPMLANIPEVKKRFLREGPLANNLAALAPLSEGIPRIYEAGVTDDGVVYLAMELLSGETVFDRFARAGRLQAGEALAIADRVLEVLVVAHDNGVVHRDLKPENIFLADGGRVCVLDFGIARVRDSLTNDVGALPEKTATKTGVALGTSHYMASEQARGLVNEIDGRTDLFALGATLFHVLAGRTVHGDLPDTRLLIAAATKRAPALATVAPDVPPVVCTMIDRALAYAKTERYPDAQTMRGDVRAVRAGKPAPYIEAVAQGKIAPGAR